MVDPDDTIVRVDVHIVGIQPKVARTLELPLDLNLAQLHEVLQASFGGPTATSTSSILAV